MAQAIYLIASAAATLHPRPSAAPHSETRRHLSGQRARHCQVRGGLCEDRDVLNPHRDARSLVRGSLNRDPSVLSPDRELQYRHRDLRSDYARVRSHVRDLHSPDPRDTSRNSRDISPHHHLHSDDLAFLWDTRRVIHAHSRSHPPRSRAPSRSRCRHTRRSAFRWRCPSRPASRPRHRLPALNHSNRCPT